jgi:hypothetical protein
MTTQASIADAASAPTTPSSASPALSQKVAVSMPPAVGSAPISLSIALTPSPPPTVQLYENVAILVPAVALLGVVISFWSVWKSLKAAADRTQRELAASEDRMRVELNHASAQATLEREQTREQAALDRKHDADEAHRERITTARRAVYLEAIGELVKTQLFLGSLAKQDLTKLDVATGLGGLMTAVAKVGILGEMATVAKSRALISLINQILFKGLATTLPLTKVKQSIAFNEARYSATQFDIERILSAMKNYNEMRVKDQPKFDALQRSFGDQQFAAERYGAESVKARLAFADGEKKYGMELIEEMKIVTSRCDELICAIREELGLDTSLDELRQMTITTQKEMAAAVKELINSVEALGEEARHAR